MAAPLALLLFLLPALLPGVVFLPLRRLLAGLGGCAGAVVVIVRSRPAPLGLQHRLADARIGAATAEVAGEAVVDLGGGRVGNAIEESPGRDDESRRAEAALLGVVLHEGRLEPMKLVHGAEALDGHDRGVLGLDRQDAAGVDRLAIQEHGAGAARPAVADPLGAGEL